MNLAQKLPNSYSWWRQALLGHFGLGDAKSAEIRVTWPDGTVGPWYSLASNQFFVIAQGNEPKIIY